MDHLVSDRALQPGDLDVLGCGRIAKGISLFLCNDKTEPPLTIAILGEWGTGKSTIARQLEPHYRWEGGKKTAFVYMDVWRFQIDSFRRQFLLDVEQKLDSQGAGSSGKVRKKLEDKREVPLRVPLTIDWPRIILGLAVVGFAAVGAA
ncbi:MAG: hypothetical protein IH998_13395, partial [Proteobacteria bacterium]|nr:hypothetical protein [Pseudomonadota bacterium]